MDWFLYDIGLRHEKVKRKIAPAPSHMVSALAIDYFII